jgi:hypothetical protein
MVSFQLSINLLRPYAKVVERDDGVVAPHPPIHDALHKLQQALIASGHEVIDWEPIDHQGAWDIIVCVLDRNLEHLMLMHQTC